jgi:hypothetical protein
LLFDKLTLQQKMSKGGPESPMSGLYDFLTQTHSLFITLDEETAFMLFGDDFLTYEPQTRGTQNLNVTVPVRIYLVWPGI